MSDTSPTLDAARRAAIVRNIQYGGSDFDKSHDMYADDAVLEFPQSGERFVGRETFKEWRSQYPAQVEYRLRRITGSGDVWVNELLVSYNGGPWSFGVAVLVFRGDKIVRESIYVMDGWDAAEWRAPWATRFDPLAGISPAEWREGEPFGLDAEAAGPRRRPFADGRSAPNRRAHAANPRFGRRWRPAGGRGWDDPVS